MPFPPMKKFRPPKQAVHRRVSKSSSAKGPAGSVEAAVDVEDLPRYRWPDRTRKAPARHLDENDCAAAASLPLVDQHFARLLDPGGGERSGSSPAGSRIGRLPSAPGLQPGSWIWPPTAAAHAHTFMIRHVNGNSAGKEGQQAGTTPFPSKRGRRRWLRGH